VIIILGGMMTGKTAVNYAYGVDEVIVAAPDYRYKLREKYNILTIFYDLLPAYHALYMQVIDNIILIEYFNSWEKTKNENISILGYSFGVPFAIATAAVQKRISHLALVYGGANLKFLIRHNLNLVNEVIDEILVQIFWLHVMNFEPEYLIRNITADSLLLINGLQDEKIPESSAQKLQDAVPFSKTIIWLESKHVHPKNKQLSMKIIGLLNEWYYKTKFLKK
jgi:cephalosporin-C deacetylase-like acetyl esterase